MVITCPQCANSNPPGARYCFYDGRALGSGIAQGPVDPGTLPFPQAFVFPSGSKCANFDELAKGCEKDWESARDMLKTGFFETFLGGMGRADLAQVAKEAGQFPDADRGLDLFMAHLPSKAVPEPRLQVEPREIHLGKLPVGQNGSFQLRLKNLGSRLLYGSVRANCPWLQPGEAADTGRKLFQVRASDHLKVALRGQHLRAGANVLEGKLVVESNGGVAEIVVKVEVPVTPFTQGTMAGAITPRQLAEKALKTPRESAPLFESGAVAQWYKSNGWSYPVAGPSGSGLGAVQQFFEALGLARPPRLQISSQEVKLTGAPGAALRHVIEVNTPDNKPIFVHAQSDQPWLTAGPVNVKGARASVPLEIRSVPDQPGTLTAKVIVTGNGNQRFEVAVSLQVAGKRNGRPGSEPILLEFAEAVSAAPKNRKTRVGKSANPFDFDDRGSHDRERGVVRPSLVKRRRGDDDDDRRQRKSLAWLHLIPALLLMLGLFGIFLADWLAPASPRVIPVTEEVKDEKKSPPKVVYNVKFDDAAEEIIPVKPRPVSFKIDDEPEEIVPRKGPPTPVKVEIQDEPEQRVVKKGKPPPVKVEIKDDPSENNNVQPGGGVPIDPTPLVKFVRGVSGLMSFGVVTTKASGAAKQLTFSPDGGTNSTVVSVDGLTAPFGIPPGMTEYKVPPPPPQPQRKLGKVVFEGEVAADDTWTIGANPQGQGGMQFRQILKVVPGRQPVVKNGKTCRLLDTVLVRYVIHNRDVAPHRVGMRFQIDTLIGVNDGVPFTVPGNPGLVDSWADFKNAKEIPDFIQALENPDLRNPGTIAHMTLKVGGSIEPPSRVSLTRWPGPLLTWDIPVGNMAGDSAVVLYWNEKLLKPGEKRDIGYAYGLGAVSAQDSVGKLGLTLGGSFEPGQTFTITAYVEKPVKGQTLTLELPDGLERIEGAAVAPVPPVKGQQQTSIVTWKAKVLRTGEFPVRVRSSTGIVQTKTISIARPEEPAGGKFRIELEGNFEPGQSFQVIARVAEPQAKQTLTLKLAPGLESNNLMQKVPAVPRGQEAVLRWQVKVKDAGKFQVQVVSSTGVTQSKTLNIVRPEEPKGGKFRMAPFEGDIGPGKTFQVVCKVDPQPGQTLTIKLPAGMVLAGGQESQNVPAPPGPGKEATVRWSVKMQTTEAGKFQIQVASSTGVTQSKTITIDRPSPVPQSGQIQVLLEGNPADFAPGKMFRVVGKVTQPIKGQTLTLELPRGLECTAGSREKLLPSGQESAVSWSVKVVEPGKHPIKVSSSTGIAIRKTLTIGQPVAAPPTGGSFTMEFKGNLEPGKEFVIQARVAQPLEDQKLTLELPAAIKLLSGNAAQAVPAADADGTSTVRWRVRLENAGTMTLRIESSTGQIRSRTFTISKANNAIF